jgi:hypothetical protein
MSTRHGKIIALFSAIWDREITENSATIIAEKILDNHVPANGCQSNHP